MKALNFLHLRLQPDAVHQRPCHQGYHNLQLRLLLELYTLEPRLLEHMQLRHRQHHSRRPQELYTLPHLRLMGLLIIGMVAAAALLLLA